MALLMLQHFIRSMDEKELKEMFRREGFEVAVDVTPVQANSDPFGLKASVYFASEKEANDALTRFNGFGHNIPPLSIELISKPDDYLKTAYLDSQSTQQIPVTNREAVEIADCMISQCENLLKKYNLMHQSKDIMKLLMKNEATSPDSDMKHGEFVKLMLQNAINNNYVSQIETGKLFAKLLSKKTLSMESLIHGFHTLFNKSNNYLSTHPKFFSCTATLIVPLLVSSTAEFDFNHLKDICASISGTAFTCVTILKIMKRILSSEETQTVEDDDVGGIIWVYRKWRESGHVSMDTFVTLTMLNTCFKNDRVGIFLLSMTLFDRMLQTDLEVFYAHMLSWIHANISAEILELPHFLRALTIATILLCAKPFDFSITNEHAKLLKWFTHSQSDQNDVIRLREVQCYYGVIIMVAVFGHPEGATRQLFTVLRENGVISKESFDLWVEDDSMDGFKHEDLKVKPKALTSSTIFFDHCE